MKPSMMTRAAAFLFAMSITFAMEALLAEYALPESTVALLSLATTGA